jgi:hypothetical protein
MPEMDGYEFVEIRHPNTLTWAPNHFFATATSINLLLDSKSWQISDKTPAQKRRFFKNKGHDR